MRRVLSSIFLILLLGGGIWYASGRFGGKSNKGIINEAPPPPPPLTYATKPEVGFLAPDFLLKTLDGREIRLSDYLGKWVVLNFWSTQCTFCLTELRNYSRLVNENQGWLTVIAINRGEPSAVVDNYLNNYIKPSDIVFVFDPEDELYGRYQGKNMPESFFIDTSGVIRDHKLGELLFEDMRFKVKMLREAPAGK